LVSTAIISAQSQKDSTPADLMAEAAHAIEKGNAHWAEGWGKRDAAMVSAIFAEDGVQLSLSGKVIKGRQEIWSVRRPPWRASIPA